MKCIPIIFGIDFNKKIPILFGSFCKFAYYSYVNKWPIIAQEQYFKSFKSYDKSFLKEVYDINEISKIDDNILSSLDSYKISIHQTNHVIEEFFSKEDAWIKLMNKKSIYLYKILDNYVKQKI